MATLMPDIANSSQAQTEGTLDWVGMSHIEMPLAVSFEDQVASRVSAQIEAYVNLIEPKAKGIHMSRLYLLLDELSNQADLNYQQLQLLLKQFISSHDDLSDEATVRFNFDYHLRRKSLVSGKTGWKAYPMQINARLGKQGFEVELGLDVPYSSTCPCSAALARQLIQQAFSEKFSEQQQIDKQQMHSWLGSTNGIIATPHSQRSVAQIKVKLSSDCLDFPFLSLIDAVEACLKTPVQAAVKREDEQEFARLNGQNLMFCEDAARRLKHQLNQQTQFKDFWLRVNHLESLHAHNAVSIAVKGLKDGYSA